MKKVQEEVKEMTKNIYKAAGKGAVTGAHG